MWTKCQQVLHYTGISATRNQAGFGSWLDLWRRYKYTATAMLNYTSHGSWPINSLAPGKFEWNFRYVLLKWLLVIDGWGIACEIALIWMSLDFTNDQSILVQVMAWCHQATSHYLSQCCPRSLSLYGVTRPQCVNTLRQRLKGLHFPDHIFKWIFLNENIWISIKISLNFVPKGSINNIPALVQIMAQHWPSDKPLSETMMP